MSLNRSTLVPDNIHEEYVHPAVYVGAAIALGFIGFFGFTMNLLVAVVIVKDAQNLWTPVNVILVNLVVGDFLVAALGNPVAMVSAITGGWYWGYKVCLWYAWFMSTLGFASIGNLTVMAVERWLLVARPMRALSIRNHDSRPTGIVGQVERLRFRSKNHWQLSLLLDARASTNHQPNGS